MSAAPVIAELLHQVVVGVARTHELLEETDRLLDETDRLLDKTDLRLDELDAAVRKLGHES